MTIIKQSCIQVQVEYSNPTNTSDIIMSHSNMKVLHHYFGGVYNSQGQPHSKTTFTSDWYPISMFGETLFGMNFFEENAFFYYPIMAPNEQLPDSLLRVTLKVMADIYFESPGFGGTEKNTVQEFTYLLYDAQKDVDFIESHGDWLDESQINQIKKYEIGTLTLDNEIIEPTDDFVFETIGTNIYVNAEEIELKGNISVQSGYKAILQAYWGIESDATAEVGQNIELAIKRDFYNFPITVEVDDTELASYCSGTIKKYQANQTKAKKTIETTDEAEPEIDYAFTVYPNPSSDILNVESDIENSTVDLLNLDGRLISSFKLADYKAAYDVSGISAGLYFVRLKTPNGYNYLRFVKQ